MAINALALASGIQTQGMTHLGQTRINPTIVGTYGR
jgi:hypothetical protein